MPDPVGSNKPGPSGYYDTAGGQCIAENPATPRSEAQPPAAPGSYEAGSSHEAIDRLTSSQKRVSALPPENERSGYACREKTLEASLTCATAVATTVAAAPTVVGLAAAFLAGAGCGVKLAHAYNVCTEE